MRLLLLLVIALPVSGEEIDWLADKPTKAEGARRAQIEETTDARPATTTKASTAKKEGKEDGCLTCGNLCCCRDCKCTATTWAVECCAMPQEERIAYIRFLQKKLTARAVPQANFQQGPGYHTTPITNVTNAAGYNWSSMGSRPMENIGTSVMPVGTYGNIRSSGG